VTQLERVFIRLLDERTHALETGRKSAAIHLDSLPLKALQDKRKRAPSN